MMIATDYLTKSIWKCIYNGGGAIYGGLKEVLIVTSVRQSREDESKSKEKL